jgi:hypothetical protein
MLIVPLPELLLPLEAPLEALPVLLLLLLEPQAAIASAAVTAAAIAIALPNLIFSSSSPAVLLSVRTLTALVTESKPTDGPFNRT